MMYLIIFIASVVIVGTLWFMFCRANNLEETGLFEIVEFQDILWQKILWWIEGAIIGGVFGAIFDIIILVCRNFYRMFLIAVVGLMLCAGTAGCIAGQAEYSDNPNPPPKRIVVKELSWYEYDSQWFNNGTKAPWYAYILMPVAGLFYR